MNAKERVLKALNHEEPDRIPTSEGTFDNLEIVEHYGEKYVFQGIGKILKLLYFLNFKSERRMTKFLSRWAQKKFIIRKCICCNLIKQLKTMKCIILRFSMLFIWLYS